MLELNELLFVGLPPWPVSPAQNREGLAVVARLRAELVRPVLHAADPIAVLRELEDQGRSIERACPDLEDVPTRAGVVPPELDALVDAAGHLDVPDWFRYGVVVALVADHDGKPYDALRRALLRSR